MSGTSQRRPLEGQKGLGKALVLGVTLLFGLLVGVSVTTGLWSTTASQESTSGPSELAGYGLVQSMAGPEAIAQVNRLHGTEIDIVDAWIGHYEEGGAVWAAQASNEAKARELLDDMVLRIQDGDSPFWGLTRRDFQGMPLFSVRDARQSHFFYQRRAQVVWVAAPLGAEEAFFSDAFRKLS